MQTDTAPRWFFAIAFTLLLASRIPLPFVFLLPMAWLPALWVFDTVVAEWPLIVLFLGAAAPGLLLTLMIADNV